MSLIRVRRNRKKNWIDVRKGLPIKALLFLLILCGIAFWYVSVRL